MASVDERFGDLDGRWAQQDHEQRREDAEDKGEDESLMKQLLQGESTSYRVRRRFQGDNFRTVWADVTATLVRDNW